MRRASSRRIHSLYLDAFEEAAVRLVAEQNRQSLNAVCRVLIRKGLGLPALELELPEQVRAWAERSSAAEAAGDALTR